MIKFKYYPNRDKGEYFLKALLDAGYVRDHNFQNVDFLLIDYEGRCPVDIAAAQKFNKPCFLYPHAALTFLAWDGMYPVNNAITANFIPANGQRQIMWQYHYPCKTIVCGWPYSPVKTFEPRIQNHKKLEILFAPIHGIKAARQRFAPSWHDERLHANRETFNRLLNIPNSNLTVYLSGEPLSFNNIPNDKRVTYIQSDLSISGSVKMIENKKYDLVVAFDTFAWISVALGKPTLMFGQDIVWHGVLGQATHWFDYCKRLKYPYEILDPHWNNDILDEILSTDENMCDWKDQYIGIDFDKNIFLYHIERELQQAREL